MMQQIDAVEQYNGWPNRETFALVINLTNDQYLEGRATEMALIADERAHIEYDDMSRKSPKTCPEEERDVYVNEHSSTYFSAGVEEMIDELIKDYTSKCSDKVAESCIEFMRMLKDVGSSWRVDLRSALEALLPQPMPSDVNVNVNGGG